jgi:hypothetical protein
MNEEPSQAAGAPRIRVMHVITHLDMGGAENVALGLIDALRDRVAFSLFAVLRQSTLSKVGQDMADRLARWHVPFRFGTERGFKLGGVVFAARSLARAVAEQQPDLIHVHTEIPELTLAVAGLISRRVRRTPLLRTVHNSELWIAWGGIGQWVTQRLAKGDAVAVSRNAANADAAIVTRGRRRSPTSSTTACRHRRRLRSGGKRARYACCSRDGSSTRRAPTCCLPSSARPTRERCAATSW